MIKKLIFMVAIFTMLFSVNAFAAIDTNTLNNDMLSNINELRTSQGLEALSIDSGLITIANIRSEEASVEWSHTRPNGEQGADMIAPDKWRGENLSRISKAGSEEEAARIMFDDLVASPAHYDNMVYEGFTKIGISSYVKDDLIVVAYMFSS